MIYSLPCKRDTHTQKKKIKQNKNSLSWKLLNAKFSQASLFLAPPSRAEVRIAPYKQRFCLLSMVLVYQGIRSSRV